MIAISNVSKPKWTADNCGASKESTSDRAGASINIGVTNAESRKQTIHAANSPTI